MAAFCILFHIVGIMPRLDEAIYKQVYKQLLGVNNKIV